MADILGSALEDYMQGDREAFLLVHTSYSEIETMPVQLFFRNHAQMPELERYALQLCKGTILDIGAGAGSHALVLQERGLQVTAIDISPAAVSIMQKRGVAQAIQADIFTFTSPPFDTLLLLMNGIGVAQDMDKVKLLLKHFKTLLKPGGQILLDSCDVNYLEGENIYKSYVGEVTYQFEYKGQRSEPFGWLYLDILSLKKITKEAGYHCQIVYEAGEAYLARLTVV